MYFIQGDSGGIYNTLGNDSMRDSKQKSSYEHGSDFELACTFPRLNPLGYLFMGMAEGGRCTAPNWIHVLIL